MLDAALIKACADPCLEPAIVEPFVQAVGREGEESGSTEMPEETSIKSDDAGIPIDLTRIEGQK